MAGLFLVIIFLSYITLGLPDGATGTAWPFMRLDLGMPLSAAGIFAIVVSLSSALSAMVMPKIARKTGTGPLLAICSLVTGACILGMSFSNSYFIIIALGIPYGASGGGVDVVVNGYVSERYSSKIMNWVHASWGFGAMVGPLLITLALGLNNGTWRIGYQILAGIQLTFAVILFLSLPMWKKNYAKKIVIDTKNFQTSTNVGSKRIAIVFSVLSFFLYCGAEASVGTWLSSLLIDGRGWSSTSSGICVSLYFGSIMAGRILTGTISNKIGSRKSIVIGIIIAVIGGITFFFKDTVATYFAVALLGIGLSPIYPCLMHETVNRFDSVTAHKVIGYQVAAATIGLLLLPPFTGLLLQKINTEALPVIVLVLGALTFAVVTSLNAVTKAKEFKRLSRLKNSKLKKCLYKWEERN